MFSARLLSYSLFFFLSVFSFSNIFGQDSINHYIDNFNQNSLNNKEEKIFITTDRPAYYSGDTLWFKAYIILAVTRQKDPVEKIMYFEMRGQDGVSIKRTYKVSNGIVNGFFLLPDSLPTGKYKVLAYTNWILNDFAGRYFEKNIYIFNNHYTEKTAQSDILSAPKVFVEDHKQKEVTPGKPINTENVNIRFFPESGTLLNGITNVIAFEAVDKNGNSINVNGYVKDDQGNIVTFFKTRNGKGSFMIKPDVSKKYTAFTRGQKEDIPFPLPEIHKYGYQLNVTNNFADDTLFFRVSVKNPDIVNTPFYLLGIQDGIVKMVFKGNAQNKSIFMVGNKNKFNTGLVRFSLLDENMIPRCERVSFINHYKKYNVDINLKDTSIKAKSKINLEITVKDMDNNPVSGDFSLSVTDAGIIPDSIYDKQNIVNYLYLLSDMPGLRNKDIVDIMNNDKQAHSYMNLLTLTNGWSKYKWKKIDTVSDTIPEHKIEEKNWIKGVVKRKHSNKVVPKINISAYLKGEYNDFYVKKADEKGEFYYKLQDFHDTVDVVIQSLNRLNARMNYVIELESNLPFINKEENDTLIHIIENDSGIQCKFSSSPEAFHFPDIKRIYRESLDYNSEMALLGDTSNILLEEINVNATRKKTAKEKINNAYGSPDYVISGSQIREIEEQKPWLTNIFESMSYALPDLSIIVHKQKINALLDDIDGAIPGESDSISELDTESDNRFEFDKNNALHYDTYRLPPKLMHFSLKNAGSPNFYIFFDGKYIASTDDNGNLDIMRLPYMIFDLVNFDSRAVKSVEIILNVKDRPKNADDNFIDFARERGIPAIIAIYTYDGLGLESNFGKRFRGMQKLKMLGFVRERKFYSPVYQDTIDEKQIVDNRVTLYWNPDVMSDSTGHASLSFYNSSLASALRFDLSGLTSQNIPVSKRKITGKIQETGSGDERTKRLAGISYKHKTVNKNLWRSYVEEYQKNDFLVGIVLDTLGRTVSYADVYVKGAGIETTTNMSGIFILNKTQVDDEDSIFISEANTGHLSGTIKDIKSAKGVIALTPGVIEKAGIPADDLLKMISKRIKEDGFSNRSFSGIYREEIIQDGFIYSLLDLNLELEQYGYTRNVLPHISQVIKGRHFATPDFREAVVFRPLTPFEEEVVQLRDPVPDGLPFLNPRNKNEYSITVDGKMQFRDKQVYKISFKQKENSIFQLSDGYILANADDMGIMYLYRTPSEQSGKYRTGDTYIKNSEEFKSVKLINDEYINSYKKVNGKYVTKFQFHEVQLDIDGTPVEYVREFHEYGNVKEGSRMFRDKNPLKNVKQRALMVKDVKYNPELWRNITYLPPDFNMFNQSKFLHEITFYSSPK